MNRPEEHSLPTGRNIPGPAEMGKGGMKLPIGSRDDTSLKPNFPDTFPDMP